MRLTQAGPTDHGKYDEACNIIEITYRDGKTVSYTYDELNRLETVTINWLSQTATYHDDAAGRLESVDQFNGTWTSYIYDDANRLIELQNAGASGDIATYVFTLDENGNRTVIEKVEQFTLIPDSTQTTTVGVRRVCGYLLRKSVGLMPASLRIALRVPSGMSLE